MKECAKLVVFAPEENAEAVRQALGEKSTKRVSRQRCEKSQVNGISSKSSRTFNRTKRS